MPSMDMLFFFVCVCERERREGGAREENKVPFSIPKIDLILISSKSSKKFD